MDTQKTDTSRSSFFRKWFQVAFVRSLGIADAFSSVVGIAGAAYIYYNPTAGAMVSGLIWQIPIGAFAGIGIVRFVMAPYWIWKEQEETIEQLRSQLGSKQERQTTVAILTRLYQVGQELGTRSVQNDEDFNQLNQDFEAWKNRAVSIVQQFVSDPDAARIHSVRARIENWPLSYNPEHNNILNFLHVRLELLENIIERYQDTNS